MEQGIVSSQCRVDLLLRCAEIKKISVQACFVHVTLKFYTDYILCQSRIVAHLGCLPNVI